MNTFLGVAVSNFRERSGRPPTRVGTSTGHPPHASWLNQIGLHFSALTRRVLRNSDFHSRDDLIDKLDTYVFLHNKTAKPYRWTYDGTPLKTA